MEKIDFGYQQVPVAEKQSKVDGVFHSVASKYDLMNDLMSLGIHRIWKKLTLHVSQCRPGDSVLDIASGTGDLALAFSKLVKSQGSVILADINASMLAVARDRLIDGGALDNTAVVQTNGEILPFPNNSFNIVINGFGLRNMTNKKQALAEAYRVLKPGGKVMILEFSKPTSALLRKIYDTYSFQLLPKLGDVIAKDADSYQYLAESIRMHPDQPTLKEYFEEVGLENCSYHNLTGGIVALHQGYKY